MLQKKDVVVFDFDGTLSASDTNFEFFKYCFGHSLRPWLYLPYVVAGLVGKVLNPSGIWWREKIRKFITPKMVSKFSADFVKKHKGKRFATTKDLVTREKSAGNKVILISASPDYLIPSLVSDLKFDAVICSKMCDEKPWKYRFLCWGRYKVIAMDKWARDNKYIPNVVRAYSDSKSDMPIMEIAKKAIWINPKTGLPK